MTGRNLVFYALSTMTVISGTSKKWHYYRHKDKALVCRLLNVSVTELQTYQDKAVICSLLKE